MKIESEDQAIEALEAVLTWAKAKADSHFSGEATGETYQRGKVIATRVLPEHTVGISTYTSVKQAAAQAKDMEDNYQKWLALQQSRVTVFGSRITHVERP